MLFELIGECIFHQRILDCPISLTGLVCTNVDHEQIGFPLRRVGHSSLAHIDIVRFLKPGKQLELDKCSGATQLFVRGRLTNLAVTKFYRT